MLEPVTVLATIGLVAIAAVGASAAFRRTHVPDVLLLIVAGILVGPVLHLADGAVFRTIAPIASIAAVLVILFDGGLDVRTKELLRGAGPSAGLAILAFLVSTVLVAAAAMPLLHLRLSLAVLLGMAFGGAGVAIVLPLIQRMGVSREALALVKLETAISDVVLIGGVFSLSSALALHQPGVPDFVFRLVASFVVAISVGLLAGWAWVRLLDFPWAHDHESLVTVGAVFLVYATSDLLQGSGPLAVLAFALVLGNSRNAPLVEATALGTTGPPTFHRQAALAIRAFVFTGLGATLDPHLVLQPRLLAFAALCCAAVMLARLIAMFLQARRILPGPWDRTAVALMFPLGLPTAAATLIPFASFRLAGTQEFPQVGAVVILLSILVSSLLVAFVLHPAVRRRIEPPAGSGA